MTLVLPRTNSATPSARKANFGPRPTLSAFNSYHWRTPEEFLRSGAPACAGPREEELGATRWADAHWKSSGSGSRPDYQWCLQTRLEAWSQAPCTRQWLQCGTPPQTDSDQKSTLLCAAWPLPEPRKVAMSKPSQQPAAAGCK